MVLSKVLTGRLVLAQMLLLSCLGLLSACSSSPARSYAAWDRPTAPPPMFVVSSADDGERAYRGYGDRYGR